MRKIRLRTKFLLSLLVISAGLTSATLLVVRYRLEKQVRESIREDLRNSVQNYQSFERLRETSLTRSARLIADLPILRALMATRDTATIQDASADLWHLSGSDLLILASVKGDVLGRQSAKEEFSRGKLEESLRTSLSAGNGWDWWFSGKRLYQISIEPIYFGDKTQDAVLGFLAIGNRIDENEARNFGNVASSEVVFQFGGAIAASTFTGDVNSEISTDLHETKADRLGTEQEIQIGSERYLATTVPLSKESGPTVSLSVLKSFDKATRFLGQLNRVLLGLGLLSLVAGTLLAALVSHTITKPLASLVSGVHALERGDSAYPLETAGGDEVTEVTAAFVSMRANLEKTKDQQKKLEQRLRQAHKMEAVGRLAGGVAHDFNNLLTIINGHSDILADRIPAGESSKRNLEQIKKAAGRAVSMTKQLLAFSRMQVLEPQVIDLNAVVADMGKMLPRLIGENIEYHFVAGEKVPPVKADPGQIEQVIMNLVVNARDAMPNGGTVTLRTANTTLAPEEARNRHPMEPGQYVLLSVSDTGHGMDEVTKAHIFEPFFTTKEVGKGTGLGLATVYGVVKQSGGFIYVESVLGKGTTFDIYFPPSTVAKSADVVEKKPAAIPRGSGTILVVEDEAAVRELACEFLKSAGYSVVEAQNGTEALEYLAEHPGKVHLVLSDMIMPKMGGLELARKLWQAQPDIKVLFMSGYSDYAGATSGPGSMPAALVKPFSIGTLISRVRETLLGMPEKAASEDETVQR